MTASVKKYSIGLLIIAKDAEGIIGRAIKSAKGFCSQIVVVDTGSADRTSSAATSLGAEIHYFKWVNDFSAARNYGLQFMVTDWVLSLDCDEVIDADSFLRQKFLLENDYCGGIKVNIRNELKEGGEIIETTHKAVRIFRNLQAIKYEGSIHEQVTPSILETGLSVVDSDFVIRHYGYSEKSSEKIARNRSMLLDELKKQQDDDWLKYHLAETEFASGNTGIAESLFATLKNSKSLDFPEQETVRIRLGQIYLNNNNCVKAKAVLDFKSVDDGREGFRLFILAAAEAASGNIAGAIELYSNPIVRQSAMVGKQLLEKCIDDLKSALN